MKRFISDLSPRKAAMIVGLAFISSMLVVILVDDFLLANFVIPGDTAALALDIETNPARFGFAVAGYLVVLVLDSIIAIALYVVLKKANESLAMLTAALRLFYAITLMFGLFSLVLQLIDVYGYASIKLVGYLFFAFHLLVLGYSVFKSGYLPKWLGIILMFASFTYIVFFVDINLPEIISVGIMLIMAIAELSLSIWLLVNRNQLSYAD